MNSLFYCSLIQLIRITMISIFTKALTFTFLFFATYRIRNVQNFRKVIASIQGRISGQTTFSIEQQAA